MAILTEMQVAEIKSHMATSEDLLLKKFKAKNSKTENTTVPIAEREAYESIGFSAVAVLKKKVKMSRPKDAGREFEDDIWCMFYKLGFRTLNSDENLTIQWGDNPSDKHQLDVVAIGDDAIFVVECKAAETLKTRQFKDEINIICQYKDGVTKALRQIYGTDKKVRFIFGTRKYRIQEEGEDAIRMKDNQIFHLNCNCKVLILDVLGEHRVFLVNDVHLKTRECRYNEVRDAQDITTLVLNIGHNFVNGMTEQALLERTQSIHKEYFKFGTDNHLLITKVDLNR